MAGRGPAPKDPARRARTNKDPVPLRVVEIVASSRPELPEFDVSVDVEGTLVSQAYVWPEPTRVWWEMLEFHPLRFEFTDMDWSYLLDTARLHAEFWSGKMSIAPELRLREAKYGFTPEDRARLRIQYAQAETAESSVTKVRASSRDRFPGMSGSA